MPRFDFFHDPFTFLRGSNMSRYKIDWPSESEMPFCLAMDRRASRVPWKDRNFWTWANNVSMFPLVARIGPAPIGYTFGTWNEDRLQIVRLVVEPDFQRQGVGTALINELKRRAKPGHGIGIVTRESDTPLALFLQSQGFQAILARYAYDEPDEDGYSWGWHKPSAVINSLSVTRFLQAAS